MYESVHLLSSLHTEIHTFPKLVVAAGIEPDALHLTLKWDGVRSAMSGTATITWSLWRF